MDQPRWDDDKLAWRRYAGGLRERMGDAYRRAQDAEARATSAEARAVAAEERAAEAAAVSAEVTRRSKRARSQLNQLERLLRDGDIPAAVELLAERRRWVDRATRRGEYGRCP